MTIDHIGAYGFPVPAVGEYYMALRIVGRIAAPLFLLMAAESARYTKNKTRLVLRLYLAGVGTGLFTAVTNFFFRDTIGVFTPGNILFTLFYTVLYIYLIDGFITAIKEKKVKSFLFCLAGIAATFIPYVLFSCTYGSNSWIPDNLNPEYLQLLRDLFNSFIIPSAHAEYSLLFILLGIVLYFARERTACCFVFIVFCVISYFGSMPQIFAALRFFNGFFSPIQYLMILALPFFMLYNGKQGRENKIFFYVYYPLHRYVIRTLVYFLGY